MLEDILGFSLIVVTMVGLQMRYTKLETSVMNGDKQALEGGCHCRKVRWRIMAPKRLVVWECNCSICEMNEVGLDIHNPTSG